MLFLRVSFCTSFAVLFCGERAEAFNPSLFFNQGFRSSFRRRQSPSAVSSLLSVVEEEGQGEASESLLESPRPSLESRKERLRRASRDVLLSGAALLSVPSLTSLSPSPAWASELEGVVSPVEERGTSSLLLSEGPSADIYSVPGGVDKAWYQLDLDTEETLFDLDFDSAEPSHGFLVGTRGIIYETNNGGRSWKQRSLTVLEEEEEEGFRFQQVSFRNGECWIIGQPPILLHSTNGGKTWERVRLSPKLPGAPYGIVALGPNAAEMTTNTGAIYTTDNGGKNWKAQVRETIDATLNRVSSSGVQGASYYSGSVVSQYRDGGGRLGAGRETRTRGDKKNGFSS
uniref:Photosynthesis system II assembly factor Ycf48/Hcf136-like domain-containing protein n=1 Tax=Chromera velia CCMP2878 TaxID=1169474 RepID=A0A0G4HW33_9ALVE|eukprot:Cvel_32489.t1-p1 / transcript=Cvel_32489.t1 / gene=Cvel_32489 / organism=Chromera_velia_CCMP2878 / gene_product=Photosystem II stability/assembly factor HCF136,, putative / transcript_product=Photosystem II stability/assembly factor HCF136,, putative / location=Cvel_scaffold5066:3097-6077(+) / protein_length=342 / sequence_SO=supercontig / SO=protein_coding / is_pseudo=false